MIGWIVGPTLGALGAALLTSQITKAIWNEGSTLGDLVHYAVFRNNVDDGIDKDKHE
tara:strand:- start:956 stop:1126 length:171 start_codon:yes stop_codon:yes gene_type:complete